jgi:hypothetical protein
MLAEEVEADLVWAYGAEMWINVAARIVTSHR